MGFGIFVLMQHRDRKNSSHQIIKDAIEQTQTADRLGLARAWFAEQHFNNYCLLPSPLMMVAHCAGITKRIRLGLVVTPLYHPPRLIEEIAFSDQFCDGRPASRCR
jgi:alkanesulfonate monooxygenase SsuD/methylene tetrahydromethanopterin reductase-like flavin-dependent oxidoreductase (luciferase family)